jgi:RNA polymerase sigma factor (sigma-70 family)
MKKESLKSDFKSLFSIFESRRNGKIEELFEGYRQPFYLFIKKYFPVIDDSVIADIYTDSFVVVYNNIKNGKLEKLSASLRSYLFSIGKNLALKYVRDNKKEIELVDLDKYLFSDEVLFSDERQSEYDIMYQIVMGMGEPCYSVLSLFYWEQNSMQEIASKMNYKTAQVAKNRKYSCDNKLKDMLKERLKDEGLM